MSSKQTGTYSAPGADVDGRACPLRVDADPEALLGPPWSFASLIHPITPEVFFSDYWGRRPLHIARGAEAFFSRLITLGELERYLSTDELYERGTVTTPRRTAGPPAPPPSSTSQVYQRLLGGSSLRIRRMECLLDPSAPVLELLRSMEGALQHPKDSLSCYVAPPNAVGLGPHQDRTEIFTLQISGRKRWRLYHRVDSDRSIIHRREQLSDPTDDFVLEPGDVFYLPRGLIHEVTNEVPSFSLTIVFDPIKWSALLDLIVERLARQSEFIAPMPAGALLDGDDGESLSRGLTERIQLIRNALDEIDVEALRDHAAARHIARMTMPPGSHIEALFQLDQITPETVLEKRPGVAWHVARKKDAVVLTLPGGYTLDASADAEPVLRSVLGRDRRFRVAEIHDSLDEATQLALARELVGCGLLRPV